MLYGVWSVPFPILRPWPSRDHRSRDTTPGTKLTLHFRPHWFRPPHDILQYAVHNILLKNSEVAVTVEILLERFQFEAALLRHVTYRQKTEIRQPRLGANRGELGIVDQDFIPWELVRPGLDFRELCFEPRSGMFGCIARIRRHEIIVAVVRGLCAPTLLGVALA